MRGQSRATTSRNSLPAGDVPAANHFEDLTDLFSPPAPLPAQYKDGINRFSLELFVRLSGLNAGNILCAAPGVHCALSLAATGARAKTFEVMQRTLRQTSITEAEANLAVRSIVHGLKSGHPAVRIKNANAIFLQAGVEPVPGFESLLRSASGALVRTVDYQKPEAALAVINGWANYQTHGKLPSIVGQVDPQGSMVIGTVNTFDDLWKYRFDMHFSRDGEFTNADGTRSTVTMMRQSGFFQYHHFRQDNVLGLLLPYASGEHSMALLLPERGTLIQSLINRLSPLKPRSASNWSRFVTKLTSIEEDPGIVQIPKFKLQSSLEVKDPLLATGMGPAFLWNADFSGMVSPPDRVFLSRVVQKAMVTVAEEGAEDAPYRDQSLAQVIALGGFHFVADRPFVFAIVDRNQLPLFMGVAKQLSQ